MNIEIDVQTIFQRLEALEREISSLQALPERQQLTRLSNEWREQLQEIDNRLKSRKKLRAEVRSQLLPTDPRCQDLIQESQRDGLERRQFQRAWREKLAPLNQIVSEADHHILEAKRDIKSLMQTLQIYLQSSYVKSNQTPTILYEDNYLIAIDKPSGFRSVPGRGLERQESAFRDLQQVYPELLIVHRLDQHTSGILLFAKDRDTARSIHAEFLARRVKKQYEAILAGQVTADQGTIRLPLYGDRANRPYQSVDYERGKMAITEFCVMDRTLGQTRVEFRPLTGRTHQLRVHAAVGLGCAIMGDRLYGRSDDGERLCLHAASMGLWHRGKWLQVVSPVPF